MAREKCDEPVQRHQHDAGAGTEDGLDRGAPARLLGRDVEQLGDEGQLVDAESPLARATSARSSCMREPAGPRLSSDAALAAQLGLALAERVATVADARRARA